MLHQDIGDSKLCNGDTGRRAWGYITPLRSRASAVTACALLACASGCLIWTGNRSPNWNDSRNWFDTDTGTTSTHAPGPADDVVFTGNYTRNCNITGSASARSVTVQNGYTGRINLLGSLDAGSVNVQSGTLRMAEGARLVLGGGASLLVGAGGTFEAAGSASSRVTIAAREGPFDGSGGESLGEALVRAEGAGAAAFVGSVGFSDEGAQALFGVELARELARGSCLGDAVMLVKRALPGSALDVRRTFNLLGDPASGGSQAPSVRVISPNGGESLVPGEESLVLWTWTGKLRGGLAVELSTDGGASWQVLAEDAANTGSLSWRVPEVESAECLVRVRYAGAGVSDESDRSFAIAREAERRSSAGGCAPGECQAAPAALLVLAAVLARRARGAREPLPPAKR